MKQIFIFTLVFFISVAGFAQTDTVYIERAPQQQEPEPQTSKFDKSKLYYGGYLNVSFGRYTVIGAAPLVGYKLTPKLSLGGQLSYEYSSYNDNSGSNYGASIFTRYRVVPAIYLHAEYSGMNYKVYNSMSDNRKWVPFLFLGGGLSRPITKNTWFTAQVLFDVLNNDNSPYKSYEPFFSVGIGVGF